MARTLLLWVLFLALLAELALTGGAFFAPAFTMQQFGLSYAPNMAFLTFLSGWLLLLVSAVIAVALGQLWQRRARYATLCYLLGCWWIAIGLGIFLRFQRPEFLVFDSLTGLVVVILTWRCQASRLLTRRY
jgi:hypothetical protein